MGNLQQSIASLTEGIRLAPKNPNGYFNHGTAHFQQGNFESATADFSKVIRLSSNDEAAYYWRGNANERAGNKHKAVADYRRFLELSQNPRARAEVEQKLRQFNLRKSNAVRRRSVARDNQQKLKQLQIQKPNRDLDLHGIIVELGERVLNSNWLGSGVDCYGENAEELFSFTEHEKLIPGHDFLRITSGIQQTIEGDFKAFDKDATSHWFFIRAWDGGGFYIETNDSKSKERLKSQFQAVEEVDEALYPYEGLFIPSNHSI